jgi:hypothetical protein
LVVKWRDFLEKMDFTRDFREQKSAAGIEALCDIFCAAPRTASVSVLTKSLFYVKIFQL